MSNVYFHIGNPKAYSTSIQKMLHDNQHLGYKYFGFSPGLNYDDWFQNSLVAQYLDRDLRFTSEIAFRKRVDEYKAFFDGQFEECKQQNQDMWLSSECAGIRYLIEDADLELKFKRMQDTVPSCTTFIMVFRNIYDSIKSIYGEYVKQRYCKSFKDFCEEIFLFRDSNFMFSLFPGHLINFLNERLINGNKLKWCFIDKADKENTGLLSFLNELSSVQFHAIPRFNDSKKRTPVDKRLVLNQMTGYPIETSGLIETHRAFGCLTKEKRNEHEPMVWSKLRAQRDSDNPDTLPAETPIGIDFTFGNQLSTYLNKIRKTDIELYKKFSLNEKDFNLFKEKAWGKNL